MSFHVKVAAHNRMMVADGIIYVGHCFQTATKDFMLRPPRSHSTNSVSEDVRTTAPIDSTVIENHVLLPTARVACPALDANSQ
jgi:hypothetical protein